MRQGGKERERGRERGRKRGREEGREGGREEGREGGREGGRKGGERVGRREGGTHLLMDHHRELPLVSLQSLPHPLHLLTPHLHLPQRTQQVLIETTDDIT